MTASFSKRVFAGIAGLGMAMAAQAANAAVDPSYGGQGTDKFTLTAGWVFTDLGGSIGINGTTDTGTDVDFNPDGGGTNTNSFMASANWRVANRHRVSLLWYQTKRDVSYTTTQDIQIGNELVPAGATASIDLKNDYFFGTYRYSFIKKDNLELAGLLGLYGSNLKFNFAASAYPGNPSLSFSTSESTSLPLPVIGGSFDWYISPRWSANTCLSGMSAKIGDIDGSIWVLTASTDYMLFHNFGVGLAYLHTDIDVDVTKKSFNGNLNVNSNSFLIYGVVKF